MIELTERQIYDMHKMVREGIIAAISSVEADKYTRKSVDEIFAQRLQLVEYGLAQTDMDNEIIERAEKLERLEGRKVIPLIPTKIGRQMFKSSRQGLIN